MINFENMTEKTIKSEIIYNGRVVNLRKDEVTLPDGKRSTREIIDHPGAVVVLAQGKQENVIMVRQFRKAIEDVLLELPAGTLEPQESRLNCAQRELEEETGYQAKNWEKVYEFYSAPGFCNEKLTLFFAWNLKKTKTNTDNDEFIEIIEYDRKNIISLLKNNKIRDAKTLIGILWWLNR
ncbi:MAG: NUDIX hydrolase [Candidatus Caldatribacteriota bacterium]|jgi:ADP-ribose pyrophosphatase|nr:NUDIX hydrolase [Atribacterota bacterium]MDD3640302.1 NUDIX hydrolase [Atribacterota bacterium]MDD4288439.1 NUDIX hydrolase [Atribacterota bacterium]MDD4764338.1 NUDIX hydrolase [Atribacterota bacterium]MDD5634968.1 NUDIX hydrolase [Atribacterota bacterium]